MENQKSVHYKNLQPVWFDAIQSGAKRYEGRLNKGDVAQMVTGDTIVWKHTESGQQLRTKLVSRKLYSSFAEAISSVGLAVVLPLA